MNATTCTLPPISDLFLKADNTMDINDSDNDFESSKQPGFARSSSVLDIANLLSSPPSDPYPSFKNNDQHQRNLKAKRKRASPNQLQVLNRIFSQTYFPSTEIRIELGKQLGMSPRTVQIWFQNKRQALRSRGRQTPDSPPTSFYLPPISPPRSPPSDARYHCTQNQSSVSLPSLRMTPPQYHQQYSPSSMSYPSPGSVDQIHYNEY